MKRNVVLVSNLLGLGGTEKGLMNQALNLRRTHWDVRVVGAWGLGPRAEPLERAGIAVASADNDLRRLTELLDGSHIVHVLRSGGRERLVPAAAKAARVPVLIDHNQFGHFDSSPDRHQFACHLFVSKFCLIRYRQRSGDFTPAFHERHRVQYLGLDNDGFRQRLPVKEEAKRALGLDPDRPVVGRVGRAVDGKWRNLLVDMVPRLVKLVPDVQIMFVGATAAKEARLRRRGVRSRCALFGTTIDDQRLATYYAACDVFVSASEIGESQGLSLCEAMACGIPVVTCSTPWADNAQIEFVDHGRNGFVANHPRSFAEAVSDLLTDDARRVRFSEQALLTARTTDARALTRQLEDLYEELLGGTPSAPTWSPSPAEVDAFAGEYQRRLRQGYGALSPGERAQMGLVRRAEHWREVRRHIRARATAALSNRLTRGARTSAQL